MKAKSIIKPVRFSASVLVIFFSLMCCLLFFSSIPAQQVDTAVPIVQSRMLLGGVKNGKWVTSKQVALSLKKRSNFVLVNLKGVENKGAFFSGNKGSSMDACPDIQTIEFKSKPKFSGVAVGANAKWNLLPRTPQPLATTDKTYIQVVTDFLKTKRIANPKIKITQIFRVDLDGDKQNEIIIAGNFYRRGISEEQSIGDYSFVLLRKDVNGKAQNILVDGEFFTLKGEYSPPNTREVAAVADLNGDGKMEIVIYSYYYEGEEAIVYEFKNNKFLKVLEAGCGL